MNFCSGFKFAFFAGYFRAEGKPFLWWNGGFVDGALVFWWGARAGVYDLRSGVLRSFGIAGAIRREVGED
jgi:hypothetical protein